MSVGQLRTAFDALPDAHLLVGADGTIELANRAAQAWLGGSDGELVGTNVLELAQDGERAMRLVRRWARSTGFAPGTLELSVGGGVVKMRCEGARVPGRSADDVLILLRLRRNRDATSPFVALTERVEALTAEIARRREVERDLAEQREWLRVTLSSIGDGVVAVDPNGTVTFMNPAAERYTGWTEEEALGRPLAEVFVILNERTREPASLPVDRVLREGVVVGLANHTVLIRRDGSEIAVADSAAPIRDDQGSLHGVVMVFQDETVRRFNEATRHELLRREKLARQRAEEASRLKDEFFAVLSHELRTPLNAVLGWAELLREPGTSTRQIRQGLSVIERNAQAQVALVDQLLEVARIASGRLELDLSEVDLGAVTRDATDTLVHAANAKGVALEVEEMSERLWLVGDALRLRQAVWNLVSNAIKFTPAGRSVCVSARRVGSQLEVTVRDEGLGLTDAQIERLFEPFWQADASRVGAERGLGLGLSIVLRVVEAHGGSVQATSEGLDAGACFRLQLPVRATLESRSTEVDAPRTRQPQPTRLRLEGLRVLVVEDEPDSRDLVRVVLGARGADVKTAADAGEALVVLDDWIPDVLLSDVAMPGMDGHALMRAVRARPPERGGAVPAAALTAFAGQADRQRAEQAGFDLHLAKPIRPEDLVEAVYNLAALDRS